MSEEELEPFAHLFIEEMRKKVKDQKDYSEQRFEDFLNQVSHIVFTPKAVLNIVERIIAYHGNDMWETSHKFKRSRELYDATRLLLVLKKIRGIELFIESSDNQNGDPDIRIVPASWMFKVKIDKYPLLEIMTLDQRFIDTIKKESIVEDVVKFIEDKKFNRDYGKNAGLLVHCKFETNNFSTKEIKKLFEKTTKRNPFKEIWLTAWTSSDLKDFAGVQVFPHYFHVSINRKERIDLLY